MALEFPITPSASEKKSAETLPKSWSIGTLTYTSAGIALLFFWLLLGDFSWSMRDRSVAPMAQWYLNDLKVPSLLFGLLISSLPAAIQFIIAPLISVMSDRHRSRWGRRIPFLFITTPLAAFGMLGLALTPLLASWLHQTCNSEQVAPKLYHLLNGMPAGPWLLSLLANEMIVSVICFSVFWTSFEVASIAGKPIFDGLINDVVPRPLLGRFYGLFRAVSLIDGMIFNYWIMGFVPTHFAMILVSIGFFYGISFMWVCLRVREGDCPPPPVPVKIPGRAKNFVREVKTYCRECFSHSYYLSIFVMIMAAVLCFSPLNVFAIPYAQSVGLDMDIYGKAVAFTFLISLGLAYFLGWMADRFHPLRLIIGILICYSGVSLWGSLYARSSTTFLIAWILHGVLSGSYYTAAASLGQRLFPRAKFAQFAAAAAMFTAIAYIFMAPVMGIIIDQTGRTYRYIFVAGGLLSLIALISACRVYSKFQKFGGVKNYIAPEV